MHIPKTILGRNVWRLRGYWNWTGARLAREAGAPVSLIRRIEHGKGDPKLSQLSALAETLKVSIAALVMRGAEVERVSELYSERIRKKFQESKPEECWIWKGAKRGKYGLFDMDGERCYPHRLVYAMEKPLMKNWTLDHTCRNPLCVNPAHLDAVTLDEPLFTRLSHLGRKGKRKVVTTPPDREHAFGARSSTHTLTGSLSKSRGAHWNITWAGA